MMNAEMSVKCRTLIVEDDRGRDDDRSYQGQEYRGKSKRRSLLEDLLDFG